MFDDLFVVCRKCSKKVHPSELKKENQNSSKLICITCYNKEREISNSLDELKKEVSIAQEEKLKYYCEACGFKFIRNKSILNKSCPYCNKDSIKQVDIKIIKEFKDIK